MGTNLYWVPHKDLAYTPATLLPLQEYIFKAKTIDGEEFSIDTTPQYGQPKVQRDSRGIPFFPVHETSLQVQPNLLHLSELTEQAMLHQLRNRFLENDIYTWISSILVSVNPFKNIPHLYTNEMMNQIDTQVRNFLDTTPPHVYTIGAQAYLALQQHQNSRINSSIIISGESGAGKSQNNALLLNFFANADKDKNPASQNDNPEVDSLSSKIISTSTHILEAFGNAKTSRNNNSSRFGKYIRLFFTQGSNHLCGASIESYLLEKSRITTMIAGERNYHIFYQLLQGLTSAQRLSLHLEPSLSPNDLANQFPMLAGSSTHEIDMWLNANSSAKEKESLLTITGFNDSTDWAKTRSGLLNYFDETQLHNIIRVIIGLLHLGKIDFEINPKAMNDSCQLTAQSHSIVDIVTEVLGLDKEIFVQSLLTQKVTMGKELVLKTNNINDAKNSLLSAIRTIYDQQFIWLIHQTNTSLAPDSKIYPNYEKTLSAIGLLDIFGFELFEVNSFEQLLINFTNEKMQRFFNNYVFELELAEYKQESLDLDLSTITYTNNLPCLDLIESGTTSILEMINDELRVPKGNDMTLLDKLVKQHDGRNKYFSTSKLHRNTFTIQHYAANVQYTIDGWLSKSKDDLRLDLAKNFTLSNIPHLRTLMTEYVNNRSGPTKSLGLQFKSQLHDLVTMLFNSQPYFIRCIKSNHLLQGGLFDSNMVLTQMNYLGLKSLVAIRQVGFPLRLSYDAFLHRYHLLQLGDDSDIITPSQLQSISFDKKQQMTTVILQRVDPQGTHWKIGQTKIFYRNNVQNVLEKMRQDELEQQTIYLQTYIKTTLIRRKYLQLLTAVQSMSDFVTMYKMHLENKSFDEITYTKLSSSITSILHTGQQLKIPFKESALSTPSKREEVLLLTILLIKARLQEQDDSVDFLQRSMLSNNKNMLLNSMFEVQSTHLYPYFEERLQLDHNTQFNPFLQVNDTTININTPSYWNNSPFCSKPVAQLYQKALHIYKALDEFDALIVQTKEKRTLELAFQCINDAKHLGLDKSILIECEQLYNVIVVEVAEAEKERKRIAEVEKERKRIADEEKRQREQEEREAREFALEQTRQQEKIKKEEEKARLRKEKEDEKARKLAELEAIAAESGQNNMDQSVVADSPDMSTQSSPACSSTATSVTPETLADTPVYDDLQTKNRIVPDYSKINHYIETGNDEQLCFYLSQFIPDPFLHQSQLSRAELIELLSSTQQRKNDIDKPFTLRLNTYHDKKPYTDSLPIVDAILRGDVECVEILIEFGANINVITKTGVTPLAIAIKQGKYAMAITLIQKFNAALSRYDAIEETGNCIGHILAQSLATLLSKYSPSRSQHFIPLLKAVLNANDSVIFNASNKAGHTAAQFFKKIIKSASNNSSLSSHTPQQNDSPNNKEPKQFDASTFIQEIHTLLFESRE